MLKRISVLIGTMLFLFGAVPATAYAEDTEQTWEMVDLDGMTLAEATDAVRELTGHPELTLHTQDVRGPMRQHLVLSNWRVCGQAPQAGVTFDETAWVGVSVVRRGARCW